MHFERITELTKTTQSSLLSEAWGESKAYVELRQREEAPLTIREIGALADMHGLKLADLLPV